MKIIGKVTRLIASVAVLTFAVCGLGCAKPADTPATPAETDEHGDHAEHGDHPEAGSGETGGTATP